ncbi:hypothetical protein LTR10_014093 [Elasticomyces elasticus]|uniref:BZIP domain-containing protein n=1 Tax=Exophiala sideris TaxID=1016849 RepID=A0ABR0J4S2_9EURO|nr:hypothetical protein LTR10_014093 [Elasticomyces elasticus]KAK5026499.1 hypothetical protein LTS07_007433 [Exophiala sideris]KAK5033760.1 hypothetical protein LTR13_006812 [Exophiala sideris]KAK5055582.1 hypothetical protein LTR69_008415 [Exophiala sideris]KAK5180034.1 hypothetical protein LTR44_007510 [Eurotiomycetes sp. CCFEE 6388]
MQNDLNASDTTSPADNSVGHTTPSQHAGRKRKAPSSGSRGVASLTQEQLAKKRANDREAQRAIRERTKQQIETLERRIQELTSQQPYQELQAVIRQKDAIQAENDEIRRRLASIMSIIQPIVGAQGLTDLATAAQHNVQTGLAQQTNAFQSNSIPATDPYLDGQQNGRRFSASPTLAQQPLENSSYPSPFAQEEQTTENNRVWPASRDALSHQRDNLQRGLELNGSGERLSFNFLLDSLGQKSQNPPSETQQTTSPTRRSAYPAISPSLTEQSQLQTPWTALPKHVPPTCPLDGLLLNFLHSRQRENNTELLSPNYPSVSSLLNPSGGHRLDPLSQLMTDIISKFPNISELPEQAATLFVMFVFMRWLINPTQENYETIPEWFRPTPAQIFTPHPAWIDHIPWPRMRDKLMANFQDYPFENWFIPFTNDLSVNWPYDPVDCLLSTSAKEDSVINPVFERHVRRLENWSVGPGFAEAFPALVETTRIRRKSTTKDKSGTVSS